MSSSKSTLIIMANLTLLKHLNERLMKNYAKSSNPRKTCRLIKRQNYKMLLNIRWFIRNF